MVGRKRAALVTRFWEKVDQGKFDDCWPWKAAVNNKGYGVFRGLKGEGMTSAQRVAWTIVNGAPRDDQEVMHICDNPLCVNPRHLRLGSHAENMADMSAKGRGRGKIMIGADHPRHKATDEAILSLLASRNWTTVEIARAVGIVESAMRRRLNRLEARQKVRHTVFRPVGHRGASIWLWSPSEAFAS